MIRPPSPRDTKRRVVFTLIAPLIHDVILGLPWLKKYNPLIDRHSGSVCIHPNPRVVSNLMTACHNPSPSLMTYSELSFLRSCHQFDTQPTQLKWNRLPACISSTVSTVPT
eukprot:GHVN01012058.1.p1 GENE.GHVN01012058.1~~GHVN01012058.1.p1  ORF type:complete len:111 (+),score=2.32 GHVN01012058.1:786-1118(+)